MDESEVINERYGSLDLENIDTVLGTELDIVLGASSPEINIDKINNSLQTIMQQTIPEASIPETPVEDPVLEASIPETPVVEPVPESVIETLTVNYDLITETNNEIDEIQKQLEKSKETQSESCSNEETQVIVFLNP